MQKHFLMPVMADNGRYVTLSPDSQKNRLFFFSGPLRHILELLDAHGADKDDNLAEAALGERIGVLQASFCPLCYKIKEGTVC